ncbi:MAG: hypothetical protein KDB80_08090 [Planctomycetes bacterium]|nr:hypothetical protein [Planctomycetota bacterium]
MQGALGKVPEIKNLQLAPGRDGGSGSFECAKDFDYKSKLDAIVAAGNDHLAGWSEGE